MNLNTLLEFSGAQNSPETLLANKAWAALFVDEHMEVAAGRIDVKTFLLEDQLTFHIIFHNV